MVSIVIGIFKILMSVLTAPSWVVPCHSQSIKILKDNSIKPINYKEYSPQQVAQKGAQTRKQAHLPHAITLL
jgi:hypothetical protein